MSPSKNLVNRHTLYVWQVMVRLSEILKTVQYTKIQSNVRLYEDEGTVCKLLPANSHHKTTVVLCGQTCACVVLIMCSLFAYRNMVLCSLTVSTFKLLFTGCDWLLLVSYLTAT